VPALLTFPFAVHLVACRRLLDWRPDPGWWVAGRLLGFSTSQQPASSQKVCDFVTNSAIRADGMASRVLNRFRRFLLLSSSPQHG